MICNNCRNQISEGSSFCEFCGSRVGEMEQTNYAQYSPYQYNTPPMQDYRYPVSVGGWIGRSLISWIPFVGTLIYFIMLFVWASDHSREETFSNWAKAELIKIFIFIIPIVLFIVIVFFLSC